MNLASEIEFYSELRLLDKARLLNLFMRSEEHTSELQLRVDLVCRLLLEKKNSSQLDPAPGADQGLHREPQVQRVPVAAHHRVRPRRAALRDPDPHARAAPHG